MPPNSFPSSTSRALGAPRTRGGAPHAWERALRRAEKQVRQRHYAAAIVSLQRAMTDGADAYDCSLRISEVYRILQQWAPAFDFAEQAAALAPDRLTAHEKILEIAMQSSDQPRVVEASAALLKIAPRHVPAYSALGYVYLQRGETQAALRIVNLLIRYDPHNAEHHFRKGLLCQHQGDIALAVREFAQALALEPMGPYAEAARDALETLDLFQLNQIVTLALEDSVFRAKLERAPEEAIEDRGFFLSAQGRHMLVEFSAETLPDFPAPARPMLYH